MLLFAGGMYAFFAQRGWTLRDGIFEGVCVALGLGLLASCLSRRAFLVLSRIGAGLVFAAYLGYLLYECFYSGQAWRVGDPAQPSPFAATLGLLLWGLPCLLYALWGSFWGRAGVTPPAHWSRHDVLVLRVAMYARRLFLLLLVLAVVRQVLALV
ncbi:hypothetical protein [Fulvimonas soli]|nr:hypothetical protein [Fulvimonas soli]TNY27715.1 hypothetical protein BV497_01470 [Fulvimonas soli]